MGICGIQKIVSGGQTGVDRAALDVALERGVPCGGWCPRGRKAEDGPINARYPLQETTGKKYAQRTALNVRDSDGTLILTAGEPTGGTALTVTCAVQKGKPHLIVDLDENPQVAPVAEWLKANMISVLNVAGPRESTAPGIAARTATFLHALLDCLHDQ